MNKSSKGQPENINLHLWENELKKEFDRVNWSYHLKLTRPQFQIVNVDSFWGQWSPINRTIKIAKRLIDNYSWDNVINILKHEIAHQIDSDLFNGTGDHGDGFKKACRLIGLPVEFQSSNLDSGSPIFSWRDNTESSTEQNENENHNMIRRVEKLLSLAQSSNENEALAAMEKVMEIYQAYNIKRVENNLKSNYVYTIINFKKQKIEAYQSSICHVIQEFYFTDVVHSKLYDPHSLKSHQVIELFGTKENVQMAEYVFYFLNHQVLDLWQQHSHKKNLPVKFKRSYMIGVLNGFKEKLRTIKKNNLSSIATSKSLILSQKDENLRLFVRERYPRLSTGRSSSSGVYSEAFESGKQDGKSIVINKGLEKKSSFLKTLFLK